jgi:hypothetical protein
MKAILGQIIAILNDEIATYWWWYAAALAVGPIVAYLYGVFR